MRTRIKFCGMTRPEDAQHAARLGVDAIGMVFYPPSPRYVSIEQAVTICGQLPAFVSKVGLFVNSTQAEIQQVLQSVSLDVLQFHGDETPDECRGYQRPYIKAVRMKPGINLAEVAASYGDAAGILLDSYQQGTPGGTGKIFDWATIPADLPQPVILAGGLDAGNVASAIQQVKPYAVDVSGGIEQDKGIKDADKMAAFVQTVTKTEVNQA